MSGYSFENAPEELRSFLTRLVAETRALIGEDLVAVILHGSLAMGSYYPPKSDIDLLLVVGDLSEARSALLYGMVESSHSQRPFAAGIEMSVLRASDAARPHHPSPFLVHFSSGTKGPQTWVDGLLPRDADLVAHMMVAKTRGISLYGPPPAELIGPIARSDYLAAVRYDIDELLSGDVVLRSPRYAVLNLCRWMMMASAPDPLVPSKEEAALWALEHAPERHHAIVGQALRVYRSSEAVREADLILAGGPWDEAALIAFRDWAQTNG